MTERNKVKVTIHDQSIYGSMFDSSKYEPDTIKELIAWLESKLQEVPAEYRDAAHVEIESVGGYEGEHHSEIQVYYNRPETDSEMSIRAAGHKRQLEEELRRHEQNAARARAALSQS